MSKKKNEDNIEFAQLPEFSAANASKASAAVFNKGDGGYFNDDSMKPKKSIDCHISDKLLIKVRTIEQTLATGNEFALYLKGSIVNGVLEVKDEVYLPEQEVSAATVDFNEPVPDESYVGVIHRHPSGCKNFSGTDDEHINSNFKFSLLYVNRDITIGIYNIDLEGVRIQIPLNIIVTGETCSISDLDLTKVKPKTYNVPYYQKGGSKLFDGAGVEWYEVDENGLVISAQPEIQPGSLTAIQARQAMRDAYFSTSNSKPVKPNNNPQWWKHNPKGKKIQ